MTMLGKENRVSGGMVEEEESKTLRDTNDIIHNY